MSYSLSNRAAFHLGVSLPSVCTQTNKEFYHRQTKTSNSNYNLPDKHRWPGTEPERNVPSKSSTNQGFFRPVFFFFFFSLQPTPGGLFFRFLLLPCFWSCQVPPLSVIGHCVFPLGRKYGELCRRDSDCESGLVCDISTLSGASVCRPPMVLAKQYAEDCMTSSDCDISRWVVWCCVLLYRPCVSIEKLWKQDVRRRRMVPEKSKLNPFNSW